MDKHVLVEPALVGKPTQTIANTSIEVPLRPTELYTILDELEQGEVNDPYALMDLVLYIRNALVSAGLPDTREEFEDTYYLHPENEQFKTITILLDGDKENND
jgi:hypothetical protein